MIVCGNEIEILAPAGNMDNLKTAVLSGADAVYFGLGSFNARRNAKNFQTIEEIKEAIDFCHLRGKKAHVTLNTLIYDEEIDALIETIEIINKVGFDAIIVQDLGAINILRKVSKVPLHASTQLSVHNVSDARKLKEMGFERVVLSREMSLAEMKNILENVDVEVEIFIHGALCMCVSGQCYFSSALGERSGNRGLCAGVCRLPFHVFEEGRYDLSLKDVCYIDYIKDFAKLGIASLKIEGRMKNNAYVKTIVGEIKSQVEKGHYNRSLLENVFSREGFTDGYLTGNRTGMFGVRSKDNKTDTKKISEEIDKNELKDKNVSLSIMYSFIEGSKAYCSVSDEDGNFVEVYGELVQKAMKKPVTEEMIEKNLCKFGGTIYNPEYVTGEVKGDIFYPVSAINELRRKMCEELNTVRTLGYGSYEIEKPAKLQKKKRRQGGKLIAVFKEECMVKEENLKHFDISFIQLFDLKKIDKDFIANNADVLGVEVPRVYFDSEQNIEDFLKLAKELGINKGMAHTIGKLAILDEMGFEIYSGLGTNITNSYSIDTLETEFDELTAITASFENTVNRINKLNTSKEMSVIVYGYIPVMLTRNCPVKEEIGCKQCKRGSSLIDRKGKSFRVKCYEGVSEIYNTYPTCIFDKIDILHDDINRIFMFNDESANEIEKIMNDYHSKKKINNSTRGCYFRKLL